jgi:hypothetical protein
VTPRPTHPDKRKTESEPGGVYEWQADPRFSNSASMNTFIPILIAGTVSGAVGFGAYGYGKKLRFWKPQAIGAALMLTPFLIYNFWVLCGMCAGLVTLLLFHHDE